MGGRARLRTLEAGACLIIAAGLIAVLPFGWWRKTLGSVATGLGGEAEDPALPRLRAVAVAVNRASYRTGGRFRCLSRAVAVQWMLGWRGQSSTLVMGVARGTSGRLDNLHAWVEAGGVVLIGAIEDAAHVPALRLRQGRG